jgi:putative addiction module component (TIGR02574 family)
MKREDLKKEALKLPSEDRAELAYSLIRSLDEDDEEPDREHERLWREEIQRRYRELKEGKAELIPAEEVFAEIRASLR